MDKLISTLFRSEKALHTWYVVSLLCNMGIIVTGAVVRVTGSGLGCSEFPECHPGSLFPHAESGIHGLIEFGNRTLTFVLIVVVVGAFISTWLNKGAFSFLWWLTGVIALGIPLQAMIGGITVWMGLNPWIVALHLMLSVVLTTLGTWALVHLRHREPEYVRPSHRVVAVITFMVLFLTIWVGTVVTGAGPHAGDASTPRNGLYIPTITRYHAFLAYASLGLALLARWMLRDTVRSRKAANALIGVIVVQAFIGVVQYRLGLPAWMVVLHLLGAAAAAAVSAWLFFSSKAARPVAAEVDYSSSGSNAMARNSSAT